MLRVLAAADASISAVVVVLVEQVSIDTSTRKVVDFGAVEIYLDFTPLYEPCITTA